MLASIRWRAAGLFLWAAALCIHRLPFPTPVARAGLGEWLFPVALALAGPSLLRGPARRSLVLPLLISVGFLPCVLFAVERERAGLQLVVLAYVAMILVVARALAHEGHARTLLAGYVAGATLSCAWGWARPQHDAWLVAAWPRPLGGTESPNMIAMQAFAGAVAAAVLLAHAPRRRSILLAAIAFFAVTIAFTFGHVAVVAAVAAIYAAMRLARGPRRVAAGALLAVSLAFVLASTRIRFFPLTATPPFFDPRPPLYVPPHTIALEAFAQSPVVGIGLENFHVAWARYDDGVRFAACYVGGLEAYAGVPFDPHSTWLGYLAEGGLFGGAVLVALVGLALRERKRANRLAVDVLLLFTALVALFLDVLTSREVALVLGVLLGMEPPLSRETGSLDLEPPVRDQSAQ